jgi:hypothetical protein
LMIPRPISLAEYFLMAVDYACWWMWSRRFCLKARCGINIELDSWCHWRNRGFLTETMVSLTAFRHKTTQIFRFIDLTLIYILQHEAPCNYPWDNESTTIQCVIRGYRDFTLTLTGYHIKPAL